MIYVIAAAFMLFCLSFVCYYITFHSPNKGDGNHYSIPSGQQYQKNKELMRRLIDEFLALEYEEVEVVAYDGRLLRGKYYHCSDDAPVDICFHGYRGTSARDFCGGAKIPLELGHNILVVDQRAQGKSEGHSICFGIKERFDCLSWINFALCRFGEDVEINLFGVSMGASTVLMASGHELPENVKCIVADCPYSSVEKIIRKVCRDRRLSDRLFYPFIYLGALLFAGIKLEQGDCVQAVKDAKVPILLIHGEEDHFVPCEMSEEIQKANMRLIHRVTFPQAGHGISYIEDKTRYEALVHEFLRKCSG